MNTQKLMPSIFALAFAAICVSCSSNSNHESSAIKIVGGKPVKAHEYKSVVGIAFKNESNGKFYINCTGTIIHPHIVLTAGHCLADIDPAIFQNSQALNNRLMIYQGLGFEGGEIPEPTSASLPSPPPNIETINTHPNLRLHVSGNADFGYVTIDPPFATHLVSPIYQQPFPTTKGKPATIVGFGKREENLRGLKFKVTDKIVQPRGHEFSIGSSGKDACEGDSGAPVFIKNKGIHKVLGIISRGKSFNCGDGGYAGHARFAQCWIQLSSGFDLQAQCNLRPKTYSPKELSSLTIDHFCAQTSAAQKRTLLALATASHLPHWLSCQSLLNTLGPIDRIDLNSYDLVDVSPLALLPYLQSINLEHNNLVDITALARLRQLETLHIAANNIKVIPPALAAHTEITGISWQQSHLGDTIFLQDCLNFDTLGQSQKKTIEALLWKVMVDDCKTANSRLLSLKNLSLTDRGLTYIAPLADMWKLEELNLNNNQITDVTPLAKLENLKKLAIHNNRIDSLEPLRVLVDKGLIILIEPSMAGIE